MKLVVDKVEFGVAPYGADYGNRALAVFFKEVDGEYTYEAPKDLPEGVTLHEDEIIGNGLFEDVMAKVGEAKQESYFSKFLMGAKSCYFVGSCLSSAENRKYSLVMFDAISRAALETQKKIFAEQGASESDVMKQLRAPYMVWLTEPKNFTGRINFSEQFNLVLCKMPISDKWNQMALVQIGNHNFTSFVFEIDNKKDVDEQLKTIESEYIARDAITVLPIKVFIVDKSDKPNKKVFDFAEKYGWRIQRSLKSYGDKVLAL